MSTITGSFHGLTLAGVPLAWTILLAALTRLFARLLLTALASALTIVVALTGLVTLL
jgi:hypothetical protein